MKEEEREIRRAQHRERVRRCTEDLKVIYAERERIKKASEEKENE